MTKERKNHWETIYQSKEPHQLSWTQEIPQISLDFIYLLNLDKAAAIIDIGGGNSNLVNFLINDGYTNITVLDISAKALDKTKKRLGDRAETVNWIVGDVTEFEPATMFDVWHDRAAFHFLTTRKDIAKYIKITKKCVTGHIIIGTFSKNGPRKCSDLDVRQYSEETLINKFKHEFKKNCCRTKKHVTPFGTAQEFLFCCLKRQKPHTNFNL